MERLVRFTLFGQEFSFYSDAPEPEVNSVIALIRNELEPLAENSRSTIPQSKMLVLGCLRIAARYVQLAKEYEDFRGSQGASIDTLIEKISSSIE